MDFNPRSREGSDVVQEVCYLLIIQISIHAPAKGATNCSICPLRYKGISIHAPAKGATEVRIWGYSTNLNFNPRSREGSDRN